MGRKMSSMAGAILVLTVLSIFTFAIQTVAADLNITLVSDPDCVASGATRIDCVATGSDGGVWHTWWTGPDPGVWWGWEPLGGVANGGPTIAFWNGRLDVFARGYDNALWHNYNDGAWHTWESLGGSLTSDPDCATFATFLWCFARGVDNAIWQISWACLPSCSWSTWEGLGKPATETLQSGPTAAGWPPVSAPPVPPVGVFAIGAATGTLYGVFSVGPPWVALVTTSGHVSDPDCMTNLVGRFDCVITGPDNAVWHTDGGTTAGSWTAWDSLGGVAASGPTIAGWQNQNRMDAFVVGVNHALWHSEFNGNWLPWVQVPMFYHASAGLGAAVTWAYGVSDKLGFEETENVYDNSGGGFMIAHRATDPKVVFTFNDATRVDPTTHRLTFSDYANAVVVAGPLANPTTAYYEANGIAPLRGEFDFSTHTATFFCCGAGGSPVYTVDMSLLSPTNDYFIMEAFQDGGHTVIVLYGIGAPGTLASGVYFDMTWNLIGLATAGSYVVHWQDTNGNGIPDPGDTFTIVYPAT